MTRTLMEFNAWLCDPYHTIFFIKQLTNVISLILIYVNGIDFSKSKFNSQKEKKIIYHFNSTNLNVLSQN